MRRALGFFFFVTSLAFATSSSVAAQGTQRLAAGCAACHGVDGNALAPMPRLAGQSSVVLLQKMRAFKSDAAAGAVMPQILRAYDEAQLAALAEYFSRARVLAAP